MYLYDIYVKYATQKYTYTLTCQHNAKLTPLINHNFYFLLVDDNVDNLFCLVYLEPLFLSTLVIPVVRY